MRGHYTKHTSTYLEDLEIGESLIFEYEHASSFSDTYQNIQRELTNNGSLKRPELADISLEKIIRLIRCARTFRNFPANTQGIGRLERISAIMSNTSAYELVVRRLGLPDQYHLRLPIIEAIEEGRLSNDLTTLHLLVQDVKGGLSVEQAIERRSSNKHQSVQPLAVVTVEDAPAPNGHMPLSIEQIDIMKRWLVANDDLMMLISWYQEQMQAMVREIREKVEAE